MKNIQISHNESHIHIDLGKDCTVLSSAILNGGAYQARHVLNLNVPKVSSTKTPPEQTLQDYADHQQWQGNTVGMMTAASMQTFSQEIIEEQGVSLGVYVTAGLSNLRCIGDPADSANMFEPTSEHNTINIILVTSASLTPAAMAECLMMITEAKCAAMQKQQCTSKKSARPASGTGTDSIVIASLGETQALSFVGKHTKFGELLGVHAIAAIERAVIKANI